MSNITLLSGLDYSGKTSVALELKQQYKYTVHHRFLSGLDYLDVMQKQNRFISNPNEFVPLLLKLIYEDIGHINNENILLPSSILIQDTLWPIKYVAKLQLSSRAMYKKEINQIIGMMRRYPSMDSYYLSVDYETRLQRFNNELNNKRTLFDNMIQNRTEFLKLEDTYISLLLDLFPNTSFIDTSKMSVMEVADYLYRIIKKNENHGIQNSV